MAKLTLYTGTNYQGTPLPIVEDTSDLAKSNFNDVVSSIQVDHGTFTLYMEKDYTGTSVTVSSKGGVTGHGDYLNPNYFGGLNNNVRSVKVNSDS